IEDHGWPSCGTCSGMLTPNSVNCLCAELSFVLLGNGSTLAIGPCRYEGIKQAAEKMNILIERDIKARDIVTV
ncbi:dihydroxy-acid dehydratase domain-containing protein, partial [Bacillus thuringiensis]|uniref:dihydroxy-acid dehydratase domain-containing protein n=1 Tax=Bacillus thuringiensis TaxID=1428 RepID=UPI00284BC07A